MDAVLFRPCCWSAGWCWRSMRVVHRTFCRFRIAVGCYWYKLRQCPLRGQIWSQAILFESQTQSGKAVGSWKYLLPPSPNTPLARILLADPIRSSPTPSDLEELWSHVIALSPIRSSPTRSDLEELWSRVGLHCPPLFLSRISSCGINIIVLVWINRKWKLHTDFKKSVFDLKTVIYNIVNLKS